VSSKGGRSRFTLTPEAVGRLTLQALGINPDLAGPCEVTIEDSKVIVNIEWATGPVKQP
jgi:hypothetical protein